MNTFRTTDFLGNTSKQYIFEKFKISVVSYTQKVFEDWHYHDKAHLSWIMIGGNLESRKNLDIQATPGEVMIYNQGETHRNRFTAHPSKNLNIEFEENFFDDQIQLRNFTKNVEANTELLRIFSELHHNDIYSPNYIVELVRSWFWVEGYNSKGKWTERLIELLNDRWNEFPSLDNLSNELGIHPVTISKYFSKNYGITLSEYMRKIKVKRATYMVMNTPKSFTEIAYSCGFSDQSHMIRLFRRYIGYTPADLRTF